MFEGLVDSDGKKFQKEEEQTKNSSIYFRLSYILSVEKSLYSNVTPMVEDC